MSEENSPRGSQIVDFEVNINDYTNQRPPDLCKYSINFDLINNILVLSFKLM